MQDIILNTTPLPHLLTLLILLPLVGVGMMAFVKEEAAVKHVAFWTTAIEFVLSLPLYLWFDPATHRMQFGEVVQWIGTPSIRYAVGIDGISLWLVLLTTLLMPICVVCSWTAIKSRVREFMITLLAMETALLGVFCALDFVLFYVFWEAMLIPMYLLIGVWGGPNRIYAAIKFFLYTLAGSLLLLVAIIVLYFQGGHTFDILALSRAQYGETLQAWLFWAFFIAFAVKVPMFPLHTWLPDAHVEAPTARSVILASILLKMAAYGFLRFSLPMLPDAVGRFTPGTTKSTGEFLVLLGSFLYTTAVAGAPALWVILASVYLPWMVKRVAFGVPTEKTARVTDLNWCEMATLAPLIVLIFWIGVFPNPFLTPMHASIAHTFDLMGRGGQALPTIGLTRPPQTSSHPPAPSLPRQALGPLDASLPVGSLSRMPGSLP